MPKRIKKRRKIQTEDGTDAGWEEYFDYIFPSDEVSQPNLKLLAMAKQWRKEKQSQPSTEDVPEEALEQSTSNIDADDNSSDQSDSDSS